MEIEIADTKFDDDDEIVAIVDAAWLDTYPNDSVGISRADVQASVDSWDSPEVTEKRLKNLKKFIANPKVFYKVARSNNKIVGMIRAKEADDYVHLFALYVTPSAQGKGVGSALMKEFLKWANHDKLIHLHVASYNQRAINFYESWGFEQVGDVFTEDRIAFQSGVKMPQIRMVLKDD
jgi:ribosomal protein S18 acetylase RimI-like enzyme